MKNQSLFFVCTLFMFVTIFLSCKSKEQAAIETQFYINELPIMQQEEKIIGRTLDAKIKIIDFSDTVYTYQVDIVNTLDSLCNSLNTAKCFSSFLYERDTKCKLSDFPNINELKQCKKIYETKYTQCKQNARIIYMRFYYEQCINELDENIKNTINAENELQKYFKRLDSILSNPNKNIYSVLCNCNIQYTTKANGATEKTVENEKYVLRFDDFKNIVACYNVIDDMHVYQIFCDENYQKNENAEIKYLNYKTSYAINTHPKIKEIREKYINTVSKIRF